MTTTTTTQPHLAREQLGQLLRRLRQEAGKTHEDLKAIGSRSKISAIESGKTRVRPADIYAFSVLYRLGADQTAQLLMMAEAADSAHAEAAPVVVIPEGDVTYRRDAVPVGPFDGMPPLDLWRLLSAGGARSGNTVRTRAREWLACALEEAGVVLGEYDRDVVALLADDCASTAQVVAGWIAQARCPQPSRLPSTRPIPREVAEGPD